MGSPCPKMKFSLTGRIFVHFTCLKLVNFQTISAVYQKGVKINPGACCLILILIKHFVSFFFFFFFFLFFFLHVTSTPNSQTLPVYHLKNSITKEQTQIFHLYLKVFIDYSNIKSTSLKISDLSVNSQKTLKWFFTVDC